MLSFLSSTFHHDPYVTLQSAGLRDFTDALDGDHSSLDTGSGSVSTSTTMSQHTNTSTPVTPTTSTTALPVTLSHSIAQVATPGDDLCEGVPIVHLSDDPLKVSMFLGFFYLHDEVRDTLSVSE